MSQTLTVLIPCKDEAHNIRACIESARLVADEILVADSLSTDNTVEIARQTGGCRIIQREFINYADFKNWAIPQASHPWVLILDADERVTPELAAEIRETIARDDASIDAYRIRFKVFFLGREIKHCGWNSSSTIRLIRRDVCRYGSSRVHEHLEIAPQRVGTLQGKILHYTCISLTAWIQKHNRYATIWAEDKHAAGRRATWFDILVRPPLRFLQLYIFRAGFLDGTRGLIICTSYACYTFQKYAMLWQLNQAAKDKDRS